VDLTHQPEGSRQYRSRYWDGPTTPLYPFGYGLSYTTFSYSNLRLHASQLKLGASATVSVDLTNTGPLAGDEVAQLYVHQKSASDSRPVRELKGFKRVGLKAGESQTVTFPLSPDELRYWSTSHKRWLQEAAAFDVWVGGDSTAALRADLSVVP
jgi:beta-glucosidase